MVDLSWAKPHTLGKVSTLFVLVPSHGRSTEKENTGCENGDSIQGSQVVAVGTPLPTASMPLGVQQGSVMVWSCSKLSVTSHTNFDVCEEFTHLYII